MSDQPIFSGNAEQKALAEKVFEIMKAQGSFFAVDAPIRQTLGNLTDYLVGQGKSDPAKVAQELEAALKKNDAIFTREERGDDVIYGSPAGGSTLNGGDGVDTLSDSWRRVFDDLLPAAKLTVADGPQFEVYDFASDEAPGAIEIHIPVR